MASDGSEKLFGTRFLRPEDDVFTHNAWDNVEWSSELEQSAAAAIERNSAEKASEELQVHYERDCERYWDLFYEKHRERFFKNRVWLHTEFHEIFTPVKGISELIKFDWLSDQRKVILEVGCGVGNTLFPILRHLSNQDAFIYTSDFSSHALEVLKNTISNLAGYLKPGGLFLFRDYGQYDMAQLRFKKGKCLSENFYFRSDGTRVYFFRQDELRSLFTEAGLLEVQNVVDRRLLVNRKRELKMYRVWIQCKYRRPKLGESTDREPSHPVEGMPSAPS